MFNWSTADQITLNTLETIRITIKIAFLLIMKNYNLLSVQLNAQS